jgi:hypothetical protein
MRARTLHPYTAHTRILGCLLVFILAQTLGWVHRGLHAVPHGPTAPVVDHALTPKAVDDHASHSWVERLFAGHTEGSDCRLYDTLTHADGVPVSALTLGLAPTVMVLPSPGRVCEGWCNVPFDARGPPRALNT